MNTEPGHVRAWDEAPQKDQAAFTRALQTLETNLETPVVPGELAGWVRSVRAAIDTVAPLLHERIYVKHRRMLEQIGEQDPEQLPRVEQLRQEGGALLEELAARTGEFRDLDRANSDRQENARAFEEDIERVVQRGLALVIHVRRHDTALATWYMAAFQRDRGVAD